MNAMISSLATSRKAWVLLVAVVGAVVMNVAGRIDGEKALEFIKWIVMTWLGAQAYEDAHVKSSALENGSADK
jgi:hypothetical protein